MRATYSLTRRLDPLGQLGLSEGELCQNYPLCLV